MMVVRCLFPIFPSFPLGVSGSYDFPFCFLLFSFPWNFGVHSLVSLGGLEGIGMLIIWAGGLVLLTNFRKAL